MPVCLQRKSHLFSWGLKGCALTQNPRGPQTALLKPSELDPGSLKGKPFGKWSVVVLASQTIQRWDDNLLQSLKAWKKRSRICCPSAQGSWQGPLPSHSLEGIREIRWYSGKNPEQEAASVLVSQLCFCVHLVGPWSLHMSSWWVGLVMLWIHVWTTCRVLCSLMRSLFHLSEIVSYMEWGNWTMTSQNYITTARNEVKRLVPLGLPRSFCSFVTSLLAPGFLVTDSQFRGKN